MYIMKRFLLLLISAAVLLSLSACNGGETEPSSDSESSEILYMDSSAEQSVEESSEEFSGESVTVYDETTAVPEIYGCTRIENGIFVLLGTCEEGATVRAQLKDNVFESKSDHGYFSLRIDSRATSVKLTVSAQTDGKNPSEALEYDARPKKVSADQWQLIAGGNYQFHLQYTLDDYLRKNTYSASMLSRLTDKLAKRVENLQNVSPESEIIYMIVPSPASTYPETMPKSYTPNNGPSRLEQVTEAITNAGIKVIDLRDAFAEHKNDEYKLYWKTDSHWSEYGAYIAYKELFDYISVKHPESAPRDFDEFIWKEDFYYGGDMAHYLEYYGSNGYNDSNTPMREYNVLRVPGFEMPSAIASIDRYVSDMRLTYNTRTVQNARNIDTKRPELPSAIVMRDSYSTQMYDILAERFDKTWYKGMWDFGFSENEIKQKQPDYIIYIIVERNIDSLFN